MASSSSSSQRPHSINELAKMALENIYDERRDLKHYLRMAEKYRKDGKQYHMAGQLEDAFMSYARAATLVLERLPYHRDYQVLLTPTQRHNLSLNGNDILERLSELKAALLLRYADWLKDHPEEALDPDANKRPVREEEKERKPKEPLRSSGAGRRRPGPSDDHRRMIAEEVRAWEEEGDERYVDLDEYEQPPRRTPRHSPNPSPAGPRPPEIPPPKASYPLSPEFQTTTDAEKRKKEAAFASARLAAASPGPARSSTELLDPAEHARRVQKQQEEMAQREREILRKREERAREQEAILQRQHAADDEARMIRQTIAHNNPGLTVTSPPGSASLQRSQSMLAHRRTPSSSRPPPELTPGRPSPSHFLQPTPAILPLSLENPSKYEDSSTDSESVRDWRLESRSVDYPKPLGRSMTTRSPAYPPPVTTTSPAPPEQRRIHYPDLMSQHQLKQGYKPSHHSMFADALAFQNTPTPNGYQNRFPPPPPVPVQGVVAYPSYPGPSRPAPAVPDPHHARHHHHQHPPPPQHAASSAPSNSSSNPTQPRLRNVNLPRECLTKFLTLAKANTNVNLETCGLLLGKSKGPTKFAVTTLLIPKQHSTSDTCTMDEEELVLEFTEARGLITLGWIHTHPTQSCFMSSLDLHTHSGFQCMLPESFAIVCAPKSTPNFGIFRLTDPPGLNIILQCKAKQAFHPHPDEPIYTDADRGHVQMKDGSIEIVDLR